MKTKLIHAATWLCLTLAAANAHAIRSSECKQYGGDITCVPPLDTPDNSGWVFGSGDFTAASPAEYLAKNEAAERTFYSTTPGYESYCEVEHRNLQCQEPRYIEVYRKPPQMEQTCSFERWVKAKSFYGTCATAQFSYFPPAENFFGVTALVYQCPDGYVKTEGVAFLPNPGRTYPFICAQPAPPVAEDASDPTSPDATSPDAEPPAPQNPDPQPEAPKPSDGLGGGNGGDQSCEGEVAEPINTAGGNKYQAFVDYAAPGRSPLRFVRHYDSKMPVAGSLGRHWRHNYDRIIESISATVVKLRRPDGHQFSFSQVNGVWKAQGPSYLRLREVVLGETGLAGWQVATSRDETETYSADGRLRRIDSRGGLTQSLTYDANGRLSRVTDSFGRQLQFGYDDQGRLSSVTDPAGGVFEYAYDAQGNLSQVAYPDERTASYLYQNPAFPHALTAVVDGRGRVIDTTFYDAKGRATRNFQGTGTGRVDIAYGDDNTSTGITDAYNTGRSFTYQLIQGVMKTTGLSRNCPTCNSVARSIERDANGNVTARTDYNGIRTTYTFDTTRNLETSRTEAVGTPDARTITTEWHATFNVPTRITEPGRTIDLAYDEAGNVTQMQVTDTASGEVRTWAYRFQAHGLLSGSTLPDGATVAYEYDAQGNLLLARTGGGLETRYGDYDANGRVGTITYANGRTVSYTYDGRGRVLTQSETVAVDTSDPDLSWWQRLLGWLRSLLLGDDAPLAPSATGIAVTRYGYDEAGLLQRITLPDGQVIEYGYDDAQQLVELRDATGNLVQILRDPMGKPQELRVSDASGTLVRRLQREYDALGRLARINGANGQALAQSYDEEGYLLAQANALGERSTQERDALYRTRASVDAMTARTTIDFNPLDQVVAVTDARGNTTRFSPNAFGEVTEEVSPDRGRIARIWQAGRLTQTTDARGITHAFEYDADGRLVRQTGPRVSVHYGYDEGAYGAGRLTRIEDESGSTRYTYNSQGRVTTKISTITQGARLRVQYGYTLGGQLQSLATPGGHLVQYAYDAKGLPTSVVVDGQPLLADIRFEAGGIAGWTWGNGQVRRETRDLDGRLTRLVSGSALDRRYGYDVADRLVSLTDTAAGVADTYGYDAAGRLVRQTGNAAVGTVSYQYDLLGNRLSRTMQKGGKTEATSYHIDAASNRLLGETTGTKTTAYAYLPSGQISGAGATAYTYNDLGRLVEVRGPRPVRSLYNALGQRVRKAGDRVTLFAYDEAGHLLGEYTPGGVMVREYVWLGDRLVGMLSQQEKGVLQVHADHLGTPRAVSNGATVLWRWEGEAFGNSAPNEQVAGHSRRLTMPLRFPGQYADGETGLFFNYHRDYMSHVGRYAESDPIGLRGGQNTFIYVRGNPLRWSDPWGLFNLDFGPAGITPDVGLFPGTVGGTAIPLPFDPANPSGPSSAPGLQYSWPQRPSGPAPEVTDPPVRTEADPPPEFPPEQSPQHVPASKPSINGSNAITSPC